MNPSKALFPAVFFLSLIFPYVLWAQTSLEVSGIMSGQDPAAIVNGVVVKAGGRVEGFKVEEIGKDFVRFTSDAGESVIKRIPETLDAVQQAAVTTTSPKAESVKSVSAADERDAAVARHATQAANYVISAQNILSAQKVSNVADYKKVLDFYAKAERELQFALVRSAVDTPARESARSSIARVRAEVYRLSQEEKAFKEKISLSMKSRKVVLGMTKDDVVKSIGRPNTVNTVNYRGIVAEEWLYVDASPKAVRLYMEDGILTTYEY